MVRGYKIFNPDWTCRGKQYKCPGLFHENVDPKLCKTGMHFCIDIKDCFKHYSSADSTYHMAEVIAHGRVDSGDDKCCTDDLEIVCEIPWAEVLQIVNTGKDCTGVCNSGNWNSGDRNSGNWNSGDRNSGNWNSGDRNSGDRNSGNWNSGDWNSTFGSSGCFNTKEQPIMMFNKPSEWTLRDWYNSGARRCINQMPRKVVEWVCSTNMNEDEKAAHPEHETTGGYLKLLDESECAQAWWDRLEEDERSLITSLPNFDAEIFRECTGIDVSKAEETE